MNALLKTGNHMAALAASKKEQVAHGNAAALDAGGDSILFQVRKEWLF